MQLPRSSEDRSGSACEKQINLYIYLSLLSVTSSFKSAVVVLSMQNLPPYSKASKQFVPQRLCLCNGTESSVGDLLYVELHCLLWELETLLYYRGKLSDPPALDSCSKAEDNQEMLESYQAMHQRSINGSQAQERNCQKSLIMIH